MPDRPIFVFGSNLAGAHGGGSAKYAHMERGAAWGVGVGRTGGAYAIPTLDENLQQIPIDEIRDYVAQFLDYARVHHDRQFEVVAIGCGIAGFTVAQMAPLFVDVPPNVRFLDAEFARAVATRGGRQ